MSKYLDELRSKVLSEFETGRPSITVETPTEEQRAAEQPSQEPAAEQPQAPPTETPEAEPAPQPSEPPATPEEKPRPQKRNAYTRIIDLGDGSPPQVFRAATRDELEEKIATAQANASRRIKELKDKVKELERKVASQVQPDPAQPVMVIEPKELTQTEELEVAAELQVNPAGAIAKLLKSVIGAGPEEIREALSNSRDMKARESIRDVGQKFIAAHPEYPISTRNENLMAQYIQKNNLAWTVKNLELAFSDLVEAGIIALPSDEPQQQPDLPALEEGPEQEQEVPPVVQPAHAAPAAEPVVPAKPETGLVEVPRRKKTVVGISSSQSAVATAEPETPHEVSVEDLLKLPSAERRRIVMRQMGR